MRLIKKIIKKPRVLILIIAIVLSIVAINPNPIREGVAIRSIVTDSAASLSTIPAPKPNAPPMTREVILSINNRPVTDESSYFAIVETLDPNVTIQIKTNKGFYRLQTQPEINITILDENETVTIEEIVEKNRTVNGTIEFFNETITKTVTIPKTVETVIGTADLGLRVYDAPTTNIRKGLDLQGGTRVLLQPEKRLNDNDAGILIDSMKERLNLYGLSDIIVRQAGDLSGNQYILVEIAGANEEEVQDLIASQGKFEAKIGNDTVFKGGQDITYVCRSPDCAGIDPSAGCRSMGNGQWTCRFRFSISLTRESAQRQADASADLEIVTEGNSQYLSKNLELFLDDAKVDELRIGSELRGKPTTSISISGSGLGNSQQEAALNALTQMKRLQTFMTTGSLPVKLDIVKSDVISPTLGNEFIRNALFIGVVSILVITAIIFIRYRKWEVAIPMIITMVSEVIILLGVASLIGWNLDLAAIAGIIVAVGTGVDHQIVIVSETLKGGTEAIYNWKERIKRAFFIIMGAYFTTVVAMMPLVFAGAGLIKGFAITTLIGVSVGVFITRPTYATIIEILLKK